LKGIGGEKLKTKGKKKVYGAMMSDRFEYKQEERDGVLIFKLKGSLDIGTVSSVRTHIEPLLSSNLHKVLFDLYDLEQIDSSGVTAFIVIFKRVRSNKGDVKIFGLKGQPREIFSLLRLDRIFEIYQNLDEAIASFQ
jgi:anti-sigma B factor antagonist